MDSDFLRRLHAYAVRARASGFDAVADSLEEIIRDELARLEREGDADRPDREAPDDPPRGDNP